MNTTVSAYPDLNLIHLKGAIDLEHSSTVRALLLDCVGLDKDLYIDLSQVTYIDSSGIANLVEALQKTRATGLRMALVATSQPVMRVMQLARLDRVFAFYPDLETALAARPAHQPAIPSADIAKT